MLVKINEGKMSKDEAKQYILSTFSENERKYYSDDGKSSSKETERKEKKALVYQNIIYDKDIPVGFAECTDSGKLGLAKGDVNLAFGVNSAYRGKGYAKRLVKEAVHWFKGSKYETLSWIMNENNKASKHLAENSGFVMMNHWKDKKEYFYMITNPSMLKVIGEEKGFKDPTINKDAALWNDTRPHYNVGHVVPERDVKFEVIKGHEDHGPQPILVWNGKRLRPRAEMIVFNSKTGEILVRDNPSYKNSNVPFELPGGGLMEGKSFLETAIIEVKQEVRMNVRDAWDSHIYYINQSPDGTEQEWTTWGDYSQICCGICDSLYTGEIDDQDKDEDMARDAKWVKIEEVNLTPAHEEAIRLYKKEKGLEVVETPSSNIENDTVHETFGPHIDRTFLEMDLSCLMRNKNEQ